MPDLPEFVYLITVGGEWPVSAIAGDHPSAPERIAQEIDRRRKSAVHGISADRFHVWRVPVRDAVEMDVLPRQVVPPSLKVKLPDA